MQQADAKMARIQAATMRLGKIKEALEVLARRAQCLAEKPLIHGTRYSQTEDAPVFQPRNQGWFLASVLTRLVNIAQQGDSTPNNIPPEYLVHQGPEKLPTPLPIIAEALEAYRNGLETELKRVVATLAGQYR